MGYIDEKEVIKENVKLTQRFDDKLPYDIYYVEFKLLDGTSKKVRVFSEKGTIPDMHSKEYEELKKSYGREIKEFFFTRLLGKNGLMAKEGREDYIYLGGGFLERGYLASRHIVLENGKTGQEQFDDNLFKLKLQVETIEKEETENKENTGKHYAISDLHGHYGTYTEIMKRLTSKDHLYILGDVIDRKTYGIKILLDLIRRQQQPERNPQITFLLGNHEMQLIKTLTIRKEYSRAHPENSLSLEDIHNGRYAMSEMSEHDKHYIDTWLNSNGGDQTYPYFINASDEEKKQILELFDKAYVILPQTINGQDYLLVHAEPTTNIEILKEMKQTGKGYRYSELSNSERKHMLESRGVEGYREARNVGFDTTICGHTPWSEIYINETRGFIRIDTGASNRIALYCIDDGSVQYIPNKENEIDNLQYK